MFGQGSIASVFRRLRPQPEASAPRLPLPGFDQTYQFNESDAGSGFDTAYDSRPINEPTARRLSLPSMETAATMPAADLPTQRLSAAPYPAQPVPEEYRRLLNAGSELEPPQRQQVKRGGFLGTLKHIGKGFLQGVALGGQSGDLGYGLGAGIGSAIRGGVSPQSVEDVDYQARRLPYYRQELDYAQGQAARKLGTAQNIARLTGTDPFTGQETPEAENRRLYREDRIANREAQEEYRSALREDKQARLKLDRERLAQQSLNDWMLRNPGRPIPKQIAEEAGRPYLAGYVPPAKGGIAAGGKVIGSPMRDDATGKVIAVVEYPDGRRVTEEVGPEGTLSPKPDVTPYQQAQLNRQGEQDYNKRVNEASRLMKSFEAAKKKVAELDATARNLHNKVAAGGGTATIGKDTYTQAEVEAMWQEVQAAKDEMSGLAEQLRGGYGDVVEVGGDGSYVKMKQRPQAGDSSGSSRKVGDVVFYQGKRHRITAIRGGQAELEPIE